MVTTRFELMEAENQQQQHATDELPPEPSDGGDPGTQKALMGLHPMIPPPLLHPVAPHQSPGGIPLTSDPNAGSVSEFELARRLGVRFDSSNAAWVARWTDTTNDRKKSRWFSIAKYGNSSARRLAIQACLHNMKPNDYPTLRDLTDVLSSFVPPQPTPGANGTPPTFISSNDLSSMTNNPPGLNPALAGKIGGQYGTHPGLLPSHGNPFLGGIPGMPNYMAGLPTNTPPNGNSGGGNIFCPPPQHPQHGNAPAPTDDDQRRSDEPTTNDSPATNVPNSQNSNDDATPGGLVKSPPPEEQSYCDPSSDNNNLYSNQQQQSSKQPVVYPETIKQQTVKLEPMSEVSAAVATGAPPPGGGGPDPAFLQSLASGPPHQMDASGANVPGRYASTSPDSSDVDGRSQDSGSEDDDDDDKDGDYDPSGDKRKKRKLNDDLTANSLVALGAAASADGSAGDPNAQHAFLQSLSAAGAGGALANYYGVYPNFQTHPHLLLHQLSQQNGGQQPNNGQGGGNGSPLSLLPQSSFVVPMFHPQLQAHHAAAAAAAQGFLPHVAAQFQSDMSGGEANAKMTCERGLHYSKCYRGNQECWIAVWNTKGGRIMHEAFDVADLGFEGAKAKAREARDAAHSNNVAVTENARPSWKSHSNTGIPHVSLDSQQLRFRAHKFGRRLCRSFSFGRRRGSYATRESAFDAAVLWLIQTPTEEEIATVSGGTAKLDDALQ